MYTEHIRGKKVAVIGHFPNFQKKWESICELSIIGVDFFVRLRRQTGRIAKAMWRICRQKAGKKDALRWRC